MSTFDAGERARLDSPIDARTRLFAIIGHPIDHVRAPVVWSALFRRYGINAVFLPAHVEPGGLDAAISGFKTLKNVAGLMFTMPHKVAALRHADHVSARAQRVGALNLLRPEPDGSWSGDNVDGAGFVAGLAADGIGIDGVHAFVNGAGGVGENIAWSLALHPAQRLASLTLFDIDAPRAQALAARIGCAGGPAAESLRGSSAGGTPPLQVRAGKLDADQCGLAINASPAGLAAHDALPFAVDGLPPHAVVADVIMEPMFTPLLKAAAARGLKVHHGRNMMNHGMTLAADFFRLPLGHEWNGGALQNVSHQASA